MTKAICSVSPVVFLYRIGALEWLPQLFDEIWMPSVVLDDLLQARFIGYDVPSPFNLPWVQYEDPQLTIPAAWLSLDLSSGEVAAMSLAFENRDCTVLLDEPMGRRAASLVGINYWGTLKILLEAKRTRPDQLDRPLRGPARQDRHLDGGRNPPAHPETGR